MWWIAPTSSYPTQTTFHRRTASRPPNPFGFIHSIVLRDIDMLTSHLLQHIHSFSCIFALQAYLLTVFKEEKWKRYTS